MRAVSDAPRARPEVEAYVVPDGTCFLFDPIRDEGYALDQFGALVWDYCDGQTSREQIAAEVGALLPDHPETGEQVYALLASFSDRGLLLPDFPMPLSDAIRQPAEGAP